MVETLVLEPPMQMSVIAASHDSLDSPMTLPVICEDTLNADLQDAKVSSAEPVRRPELSGMMRMDLQVSSKPSILRQHMMSRAVDRWPIRFRRTVASPGTSDRSCIMLCTCVPTGASKC